MKTTRSAGCIILNSKGEVVVVNQNSNSWSLPKGHVDEGEDELGAAMREASEEAGINDLLFVRKLGTYERYRIGLEEEEDRSEKKAITLFLFHSDQEELRPKDPANPEARWVPKGEVAALLTHPKDRAFFESVMEDV